MRELTVDATLKNLDPVQEFIDTLLREGDCPPSLFLQISLAVEEIYVNIVRYAYGPAGGQASICCNITKQPHQAVISFRDQGTPFNPLDCEDVDITLSAEEREVGGLGIFLVRRVMDDLSYRYENGCNVLTMKKTLESSSL